MKKIVSLLLAVTMLISLAGCGGSGSGGSTASTGDDVVLKMWCHQNDAWNDDWQRIIDDFEAENEGITIELEIFPYEDFEAKVQTSLIDGEGGADIYELWGGWALDYAPAGVLMEIPEEFAAEIKEETYEPTRGTFTVDDKLYGVPLEFNIENGALLINKVLMDEAGLKAPTTWEEMRETAIAGTKRDGDVFEVKGYDFVNLDNVMFQFLSLILQQGGNYWTEEGTFNMETEEAKVALEELASFLNEDHVTDLEGLTNARDMEGYQWLFANRVMMVPRGPWVISEGMDAFDMEYGVDFDYVEQPWYGDEHKFASETGWGLAINGKSSNQEAAMKFIEYAWQDDVMLGHNITCTQIPAKKSLAADERYLEAVPYASVLTGILDDAQFIGPFNTDRVKEIVNSTFIGYCSGDYATTEDALADMNTSLNKILK